ncbi:hypothetical protein AB4Z47_23480 [Nocardia sp. 2TAF39]
MFRPGIAMVAEQRPVADAAPIDAPALPELPPLGFLAQGSANIAVDIAQQTIGPPRPSCYRR